MSTPSKSRAVRFAAPLALALHGPMAADAASDMFLRVDGVAGQSMDKAYKGAIDVLSWSWGVTTPANAETPLVQAMAITKWQDSATVDFFAAAIDSAAAPFRSAELIVRSAGGTPLVTTRIEMKDVRVLAVSTGGSRGEDRLVESISLSFSEVCITTNSLDRDKVPVGEETRCFTLPGDEAPQP